MTRFVSRLAGILTTAAVLTLGTVAPALAAPVPDPGNGKAPPGADGFLLVMGWGKWIALAVLVMALIFAGVRMAWGSSHTGNGGEHAQRIAQVLAGTVIVSGATSILGFLVT